MGVLYSHWDCIAQELTDWLSVFLLFQCTICLQLPPVSLGNLSAVAPKIPRSCSSALWTAVLASCPPCIPKAKRLRRSLLHVQDLRIAHHLLFSYSHRCVKDVNQIHGASRVMWSLEGGTGLSVRTFQKCPRLSHFSSVCWARWQAGMSFKGNLKSHFLKIPVTSCLSALKRHQWMCPWMGWPLLKARKTAQSPEAGWAASPCFPSWLSDAQSWTVRDIHVQSRCGLDSLKLWLQHLSYVAHANCSLLSCSSGGKIRFYICRPTLFLNFKDLLFTSTFKGKIFKGLFICYKSILF